MKSALEEISHLKDTNQYLLNKIEELKNHIHHLTIDRDTYRKNLMEKSEKLVELRELITFFGIDKKVLPKKK